MLAEKIYEQRKALDLSQEQFAEKLGVSRQAVSKWESGQSMPDLDKIIAMSELFGVTTDFLLKNEKESEKDVKDENVSERAGADSKRDVETESDGKDNVERSDDKKILNRTEVEKYMRVKKSASIGIGLGVMLVILSVIAPILADALTSSGKWAGFRNQADGIGAAIMFAIIMLAVGLFVYYGMTLKPIEEEIGLQVALPEDLLEDVKQKEEKWRGKFTIHIVAGVMLCVASVIPSIIIDEITERELYQSIGAAMLFCMVAVGVFLFVKAGIYQSVFDVLLQRKDTPRKVKEDKGVSIMGAVAGCYWCIITAIYLLALFLKPNMYTWVIWPVAGLVFSAIAIIISHYEKKKND